MDSLVSQRHKRGEIKSKGREATRKISAPELVQRDKKKKEYEEDVKTMDRGRKSKRDRDKLFSGMSPWKRSKKKERGGKKPRKQSPSTSGKNHSNESGSGPRAELTAQKGRQ